MGTIKLLPHHIGNYTNFVFSDYEGRERIKEGTKENGFSDRFIANEEKIFETIKDEDVGIEFILMFPDSICQTDYGKCSTCLDHRYDSFKIKRMKENELYRDYIMGLVL